MALLKKFLKFFEVMYNCSCYSVTQVEFCHVVLIRIKDYFINKSFLSLTASQVLGPDSRILGSGFKVPRSLVLGSRRPWSRILGSRVLILDYVIIYAMVLFNKNMFWFALRLLCCTFYFALSFFQKFWYKTLLLVVS